MNPRPYQAKAVSLLYDYFRHNQGNPVLEAPTAAGKSVIQSNFIKEILDQWPEQRILCLTHVKELVEQNYLAMRRSYPGGSIGINSAALGQRDTEESIIFASIQSVYSRAHELGRFDLILIDECHLVPVKTSSGMYRKFIDDCKKYNPKIKVVGFTATHYRLDNGPLIEGDNRIFTDIIPAKAAGMSIDDLLGMGYLSPLTTAPVQTHLDTSDVPVRMGEYVLRDLVKAVDTDSNTKSACNEIMGFGVDREAWLIFASSVDHAHHIESYLQLSGISCRVITGQTPGAERDDAISAYRQGHIRCLINVNVLTTGFDAPHTDLLAFMRPTMSTSLYVQMAGRGMRIHPGKQDCLVLDFAGLIERHGPVNDVDPPRRRGKKKDQAAPIKECGKCYMLIHAAARSCPYCGEEFNFDAAPKIAGTASTLDVLSKKGPERVEPTEAAFSIHQKYGSPDSMRVDYYSGPLRLCSEWVCLFHEGGARNRAASWWREHVGGDLPADIEQAVDWAQERARIPDYLYIQQEGKFVKIVSRGFEQAA